MTECRCLCAPVGHEHQICTGTAEPGRSVPLPGSPGTRVPACLPCHRAALPHRGQPPVRRASEPPPQQREQQLEARDWDAAALARPGRRSARWPKAATTS
ncbi:hypothetical protein [Amycolatopsis solani]|uniref:hypothetical protein n=1 Tax=Amycolatopsis solani TaxID=3028615 RepID=UPI0025B08CB0|nr:hypothetical protein [Amycolatopsis sp. MEP2-6]